MKQVKLFKSSSTPNTAKWRPKAPKGKRLYAIGDVHGCKDHLVGLMDALIKYEKTRSKAKTYFAFLGDLIDRGPDSAGVVEWIMDFNAKEDMNCVVLMGNHEAMFLEAYDGNQEALTSWLVYGGEEALESYGVRDEILRGGDLDQIEIGMRKCVPPEHVEFLRDTLYSVEFGDYLLVHAGVDPKVQLDKQDANTFLWIREPFLSHNKRLKKMIVHGHTIEDEVKLHPHRIAVDTGAYAGGTLSAICLEDTRVVPFSWPSNPKND